MFGRSVAGVVMVCTPAPGMLNAIVSRPGAALASSNAWRKLPAPKSFVLMTVNVAASAGTVNNAKKAMANEVHTDDRFMRCAPGYPKGVLHCRLFHLNVNEYRRAAQGE